MSHYSDAVSAGEIIHEIERLSSSEKAKVLSALLRSQTKSSNLSPAELIALADEMVTTQGPAEADLLEATILAGFYADDEQIAEVLRRRDIADANPALLEPWDGTIARVRARLHAKLGGRAPTG